MKLYLIFMFLFYPFLRATIPSVIANDNVTQTAIIFAGAGSGGVRYGNNSKKAAKYFLSKGMKVKILAGIHDDHQGGWEFLNDPKFKGKIEFVNLYKSANTKEDVENIFKDSVLSSEGDLHLYSSDHGTPNKLIVDNDKLDLNLSFVQETLKDYQKKNTATRITMLGVQCYAGTMHNISHSLPNSCSSMAIDATREHQSEYNNENPENSHAIHSTEFFNGLTNAATDLNNDNKITFLEAHFYAKKRDHLNQGRNGLSSIEFARKYLSAHSSYQRPPIHLNEDTASQMIQVTANLMKYFASNSREECHNEKHGIAQVEDFAIENLETFTAIGMQPLSSSDIAQLPDAIKTQYNELLKSIIPDLKMASATVNSIATNFDRVSKNLRILRSQEETLIDALFNEIANKPNSCKGAFSSMCISEIIMSEIDEYSEKHPSIKNINQALTNKRTEIEKLETQEKELLESMYLEHVKYFHNMSLLDDFFVVSKFQKIADDINVHKFKDLLECETQEL